MAHLIQIAVIYPTNAKGDFALFAWKQAMALQTFNKFNNLTLGSVIRALGFASALAACDKTF